MVSILLKRRRGEEFLNRQKDFTLDHFGPGREVEEPDASDSIVDQVNPVGRSLGVPATSTANREGPSGDDRLGLRRFRRNRGIPRERLDL